MQLIRKFFYSKLPPQHHGSTRCWSTLWVFCRCCCSFVAVPNGNNTDMNTTSLRHSRSEFYGILFVPNNIETNLLKLIAGGRSRRLRRNLTKFMNENYRPHHEWECQECQSAEELWRCGRLTSRSSLVNAISLHHPFISYPIGHFDYL